MKLAIVGATGMVGEVMLKVLAERNFPITELIPVASERSVGKTITYNNKDYKVVGLETAVSMRPDIALFSAGGSTSLEWAPKFADAGTTVVDNSSAWRMDLDKKLIVPEINAHLLTKNDPMPVLRTNQSEKGMRLSVGRGKAEVFKITNRATCSGCASAQVMPIRPPQSCTTRVRGALSFRLSISAVKSSTRWLRV